MGMMGVCISKDNPKEACKSLPVLRKERNTTPQEMLKKNIVESSSESETT